MFGDEKTIFTKILILMADAQQWPRFLKIALKEMSVSVDVDCRSID